jgi:uncharacterized membrane protein
MNKTTGLILLVIGVVILAYGFAANDSVASATSRLFTGAPTNKALVLMVGGGILSLMGAFSLFGKR